MKCILYTVQFNTTIFYNEKRIYTIEGNTVKAPAKPRDADRDNDDAHQTRHSSNRY